MCIRDSDDDDDDDDDDNDDDECTQNCTADRQQAVVALSLFNSG